MKRINLISLVLFACAAAHGEIYTGDIEYTAGAGANEATIAVDFDFGNSFLFSFQWDGAATGWDALDALNAGALDVFATGQHRLGLLYQHRQPDMVIKLHWCFVPRVKRRCMG